MSKFYESITKLTGRKIRFYCGGGEEGVVQGHISKVDGDLIYIEKDGDILGTMHTISINADAIRFFEEDILVDLEK